MDEEVASGRRAKSVTELSPPNDLHNSKPLAGEKADVHPPGPTPPAPRGALAIIFLVVVIDLLGFGVLLPLLPIYGEGLGASKFVVGLLSGVFSMVQFFAMPLWGRLSDRIGRRPVLLAGLIGSACFHFLFGWAAAQGSLWLLFVARIGCGAASATISTAQAYIADSTPPEKRTKGMALIGAAFGVGFTFGPLLGLPAFLFGGDDPGASLSPIPGYLPGVLSLIAFFLGLALLPESLQAGNRAAAGDRFQFNVWRTAFSTPGVAIAVFAFFGLSLGFTQFEATLSLLLDHVYRLSKVQLYLMYFYIGIALVVAQGLVVRPLSSRMKDEHLALLGTGLMLLGIALGMAALAAASLHMMIGVLPVVTIGYALMSASLQAIVSKRTPADRQGAVLGVNQSTSALARIIGLTAGPSLLGWSLFAPYAATAVILVGVGGLLLRENFRGPRSG